jgi:(p)ppGpp synthase/HD superfamily hydrolase
VLVEAENEQSPMAKRVAAAVNLIRQDAENAAFAATDESLPDTNGASSPSLSWPRTSTPPLPLDTVVANTVTGKVEYADPEHVCTTCLPIYGDEIVGTRPENDYEAVTTVHRIGCPHAQRAINIALAENKTPAKDNFNLGSGQRVDSVSLRSGLRNGTKEGPPGLPVKLEWSDFLDTEDDEFLYPCEVVVHAEDRKLLLADCSEVVSELSEIVKTGSQTTKESATLVFLINVRCLADLQTLMDSLGQIRSVMAVERRVNIICASVRFLVLEVTHIVFSLFFLQFGSQLLDVSLP